MSQRVAAREFLREGKNGLSRAIERELCKIINETVVQLYVCAQARRFRTACDHHT